MSAARLILSRQHVRATLAAIERRDTDEALRLLVRAEWDAFEAGDAVAGEFAQGRWRLACGDVAGAVAVLRRLAGERRA
jgi:hypothetical protein